MRTPQYAVRDFFDHEAVPLGSLVQMMVGTEQYLGFKGMASSQAGEVVYYFVALSLATDAESQSLPTLVAAQEDYCLRIAAPDAVVIGANPTAAKLAGVTDARGNQGALVYAGDECGVIARNLHSASQPGVFWFRTGSVTQVRSASRIALLPAWSVGIAVGPDRVTRVWETTGEVRG
jgi:hypothetical protein